MKYPNGELAHIGDEVRLWFDKTGEERGKVVCSIDTNEYSEDYPASEWSYLEKGILVNCAKAGLIHYLEPEKQMALIERGAEKTSGTK
jgi:hypothetical protein